MNKWVVVILFFGAFLLRTINLSYLPAGFTPDEASFGYDAYSLLHTGKDQWGEQFPLTFKSFGDYKLPLYTYLSVPSVAIFGLNEFAVRIPNALLGALAVIATYLLVWEFFDKRTKNYTPLIAALFLLFSPWHIALSRGAFEANLTSFFLTMGILMFLKARDNQWLLSLSMLFFGLNMYSYHSARIVTPLIVMVLLWLYRNEFPRTKKYTAASVVFIFFFVTALGSTILGSGSRAATSTVFSQNLGSGIRRAAVVNNNLPQIVSRVFYNEPSYKITKIVSQYITYFSPQFLFTEGARETTYGMIPGVGLLSIIEVLGLVIAVFIMRKEKHFIVLVFWILIAAIPAAVSIGPGHAANRAAILMPAIQILSAYGIASLLSKPFFKRVSISVGIFIISGLGIVSFGRYYFEQPVVAGNGMVYGMQELFLFLREYPTKHIILSRSISEPHIYAAVYDPISPDLYQIATKNWKFEDQGLAWVDQLDGYFVGRYTISTIDKSRDFQFDNTFIVGKRDEMPEAARIVKTILTPSKAELWVVAEKNI